MRYTCEEPGFEDAFLEFSEVGWTRRALNSLRTLDDTEEYFAIVRSRLTAIQVPALEGDDLTAPEHLTPDALDRIDIVAYNWIITVIVRVIRDVTNLGEAPWRRLRASQGETAPATDSQTAQ